MAIQHAGCGGTSADAVAGRAAVGVAEVRKVYDGGSRHCEAALWYQQPHARRPGFTDACLHKRESWHPVGLALRVKQLMIFKRSCWRLRQSIGAAGVCSATAGGQHN